MKPLLLLLAIVALSIGSPRPVVVSVLVPPKEVATGVATGAGRVLTVAHVLDGATATVP